MRAAVAVRCVRCGFAWFAWFACLSLIGKKGPCLWRSIASISSSLEFRCVALGPSMRRICCSSFSAECSEKPPFNPSDEASPSSRTDRVQTGPSMVQAKPRNKEGRRRQRRQTILPPRGKSRRSCRSEYSGPDNPVDGAGPLQRPIASELPGERASRATSGTGTWDCSEDPTRADRLGRKGPGKRVRLIAEASRIAAKDPSRPRTFSRSFAAPRSPL